ncbi:MAG: hypothetical protein GY861_14610 [bacterium]|nr:hypothetical protein [bacterium]
MRTIKFRAWVENGFRGQNGMYVGFSFKDIENGRAESNIFCDDGKTVEEPNWDKIKLMQFTGLLDKNGKEIYEGDVLSYDGETNMDSTLCGYVREHLGTFVCFYGQDALGRDCFDELYQVASGREIIGNIHENPELLEQK